jgi:hypothetical protein
VATKTTSKTIVSTIKSQVCIKGLDGSNVFLVMIEQVYAYGIKITIAVYTQSKS